MKSCFLPIISIFCKLLAFVSYMDALCHGLIKSLFSHFQARIRRYRQYHREVRLTFSLRFSLRFNLRFKQTNEFHPDVNLSSYSSAVLFNIKTQCSPVLYIGISSNYICCIEFNALSNAISLLTGINLHQVHVRLTLNATCHEALFAYDVH